MESAKKKLKRSRKNEHRKERRARDGDRISGLPDALLHHILSFLNTKHAVQTCVLSTRWRYLWNSLPDLDFDCRSDFHFVDKVLFLRHSLPIQKFRFVCSEPCHPSRFRMFTSYAVRHNVQELDLEVYCEMSLNLPPCLFTCKSLRFLKLTDVFSSINLPTSLGFPCLKTLHLEGFHFSDENVTGNLFSSSPVLENLLLVDSTFRHPWIFNIFALQLKTLTILNCASVSQADPSTITVCTPRLISFKCEGDLLDFSLESLSSLDNAQISLKKPWHYNVTDSDKENDARFFIKMLRGLCNATTLTLSWDTLEMLSSAPRLLESQPSPLCNLKYLKLRALRHWGKYGTNIPIHVIKYLLQGSPNAETLILECT